MLHAEAEVLTDPMHTEHEAVKAMFTCGPDAVPFFQPISLLARKQIYTKNEAEADLAALQHLFISQCAQGV